MRRRDFIKVIAGSLVAWPIPARAQQPAAPVVGVLSSASPGENADRWAAFHQGLREIGYIEGQNVSYEYRWAAGQYDRLTALATDLVSREVAVIFTSGAGSLPAQVAKATTASIPIVFAHGNDPVRMGLVASMNRPGGNVTGVSFLAICWKRSG